jgi:uncharacterized protein (DUF342 family)
MTFTVFNENLHKYDKYNCQIIEGDLDESNTPLIFDGDVIVYGDIKENAVIEASGNVIAKTINFAQVYSKGCVFADLITGAGKDAFTIIRADKGVFADIIQYANIICFSNVEAKTDIRFSDIFAEGEVKTLKTGCIIGGNVSGYCGVSSGKIGSPKVETKIIVGYSHKIETEMNKLNKEKQEVTSKINSCKLYLEKLKNTEKKDKYEELKNLNKELEIKFEQIISKENDIEQIVKNKNNPEIIFHERIFQGAKLMIKKSALIIDKNIFKSGKAILNGRNIDIIYF